MEMNEIPDRLYTRSISPYSILAQNRHMDGARSPSEEPNPSDSHYEEMRDTPEVSLDSNSPSQGILHAPTPPFQYRQYLESPLKETRPSDLQNERIGETFEAPFGVNSLGEWYGTVPTPGSHYTQYLERLENQSKIWDFSKSQHDEEREAATTAATSNSSIAPTKGLYYSQYTNKEPSLVESSSSKFQCDHMKNPPGGSIDLSSSSGQPSSDEELEAKTSRNEHQMTFLMGCRKIKDDCKAGNFPVNVVNKAKYLWKILSEAKDDCLCSDGTMGKLQALLVACCIYIACRQCNISRTFVAIRILTNTLSSEYKESIRKSFEILWEFRNDTNCSCLRAFRAPPEECCQICHKLHKKSTSSGTFEPLELCMRCLGAYHMSCATKSNAIIDTPEPGDLVCRRCVPCTIHPHVEQDPSNLTEKTLGLALSSVVSYDSERTEKESSTDTLSDELSGTSQLAQGQLKTNITGNEMIEQLKERCRKAKKELDDAHEAYFAALEDNSFEITMPDSPAQSKQT
ncbi:hypothetical protein OCU04_000903 [Sclerotinia nivalis]|uniref:Transcription factor TFIIB cyclin-like domain-containing protein n=1 Tax=Sclerotinia nivalis TaxID=352851 RepID=A0A9X0AX29_9HELO|nr:hypothetical protein OCU04_000903 [Sclerotinia nivalis]